MAPKCSSSAWVVVFLAEAGDEDAAAVEDALVGQVVDRVDGRRRVQRLHPLDGVDVDGDQRGLPVVAVDDVGVEAERLAQLQRPARQEREPLQVVGVALGRAARRGKADRSSG